MNADMTNAKRLATLLHPARQEMVIADIVKYNDTTKMFVLKSAEDKELAYFEAGSYIPVFVEIDGNVIERPYGISSSPKESEEGIYRIVVKEAVGGYVSTHILQNWKAGDKVTLGSPKESEGFNPIRDSRNLIALAGGVGITPFYSMAKAVADGTDDHDLTLFYGANTYDEMLFKDEWKALEEQSGGKFKMIPVIANEDVPGCEQGFITLDIIKKYAEPETASIFISGPGPMINAMNKALAPLGLPKKRIRISMNGDGGFNHGKEDKTEYKLKVHMAGDTYEMTAKANETILVAIEKAGLRPAAYCRSGICGFCRSMVISGDFTLATDETGVRKMDKHFGFIHPCCSYPASDLEIVVQRAK